jgi:hypothetical protein
VLPRLAFTQLALGPETNSFRAVIMDTQARSRPSLQPLFTEYHNLEGYPRSAFSVAAYSPYTSSPSSPRATRPMPSLVYPSTPHGEASPRRHDRATIEGYDPRRRGDSITPDGHRRNLRPIAEHSPTSPRAFWPAPTASFSQTRRSSGYQIPRHLTQVPRRQSIVEETRSLLLTGIPSEHVRSIGRVMAQNERRRSLPNSPLTARRRHSHTVREQLRVWGHVYYGNAVSADCFVVAVGLRRPSETPSVGKENETSHQAADTDKRPVDKANTRTDNKRVTIRARVRPRDMERKPFILQRSFDLDEIRSTIPDPPATPSSASRRESVSVELLSPSAAVTPRSADLRRRASDTSSQGGETLKDDGKDGKGGSSAESINRNLIRGANALPMRKFYSSPSLSTILA